MRIQVVHRVDAEAGIAQGIAHAAEGALAVLGGRGHVIGVGGDAVAGEFAVDAGAALLRVFVFLEHHGASAFAQHEAVAILVPRTAGAGRIIVARRHRARRGKSAHREFGDRRFGPPAIMTSASP
jgi:hypothetical protein